MRGDEELEKKLINDGGSQTRIWGYVLIVVGVMTGFWGGSMFSVSLMNKDFMSFLTSAFVLIMLGIWVIKSTPKWIVLGTLYLTLLITALYMVSTKMDVWVAMMGFVVEIGFGWWLTTKILYKK